MIPRVKGDADFTAKRTDKVIKACPVCGLCWEPVVKLKRPEVEYRYQWYEDFPKFGKGVKTCPKCQ